ncbi:hypothetical protein EJ05DRAFT_513131 [Pseudovirgaria hyperparasitica]|uniref:Altered inheritance of mitochondria protein 32 n=1 Tax=Pseudovirgaria hyperparasitica TaxID=470096 RepID=A0A6A6W0M7_9PEZI|nr:uncharacterized protein EJ05DRAFT_513131 [Pseudovirgaria hyperparasitica]KAF2755646.1 hypothetical protein EJ05DRAFT_513131 [Pseudovirgaria hyperparasitica]
MIARSRCSFQRVPKSCLSASAYRRVTSGRVRINVPSAYPVVENCPVNTCECRAMPSGLDIDQEKPLGGTMPGYSEQILISTGTNEWGSRIEEDENASFIRDLKSFLTRGGKYMDPFHNVMVTNSSLPADSVESSSASAYLLPSFKYVSRIPVNRTSVETFLKGFVLPEQLHEMHKALTIEQKAALRRDSSLQETFFVRDVDEILILICGHGKRDQRCGILGPLLQNEFKDQMRASGFDVLETVAHQDPVARTKSALPPVRVGMISHIGGHKYAGNVVIYIPPSWQANGLRGKGLWYGRVTPYHVEGIIKASIMEGKIIKELFRGGITEQRAILRL